MNLSYFETLAEADGYIIETIPWVGYVKEIDQVLYCNKVDQMIIIQDNQIDFVNYNTALRYNATNKLVRADILGEVVLHNYNSNTEDGIVIYRTPIQEIPYQGFYEEQGLISIIIPKGCLTISQEAFYRCTNLKSIVIPDSVLEIGYEAFEQCNSLTQIVVPDSTTTIRNHAFRNCDKLTSVTFGSGVLSIGKQIIRKSQVISLAIESLQSNAFTPPQIAATTFEGVSKTIPLYVPAQSISAYQSAQYWSEFTNIQAIPQS